MNLLSIKFVILLIFASFGLTDNNKIHPLHVSTTEININTKDKTLEITCKLFTDDFESTLIKFSKQKVELNNAERKTIADVAIKNYLQNHLRLRANKKQVNLNYVGYEIDHEATNVYFEVDFAATVTSVEITDTILYDSFEDQMNIVHVMNGPHRQSTQLLYPANSFVATF